MKLTYTQSKWHKASPCASERSSDVLTFSRREALFSAFGLLLGSRAVSPLIAAAPKAKAKSVIQIWMWGGPAHLDTFDPKPEAGNDYSGPLNSPIETNVSGIRICELLPLLAKQADKYSLIRAMTHGVNAHETASYTVQTGRLSGGHEVYPSVGAGVSLFKGYNAGYKGLIPPYIVLPQPQGRFSEAGFLGSRYKPFATGGDPAQARFAVEGVVAQGITDQRQQARREYLHQLNTLANALPGDPQLAAAKEAEEQAYELILGDAGKVFDLAQEKDDLRDLYGRNTFGQSCLAARRQARLSKGVAAVEVAQVVLLLGEIEHFAGIAQNQFVGLLLGLFGGGELGIAGQGVGQGIELVQVLAASVLALVGDALRHHAFHGKARLGRVAAGGERFVARAQETGFAEASLGLGEHDVGRDETLVSGVIALEEGDHRAHAGVDLVPARQAAGLHGIGRRLVGVDAVRHAADEGILVGLFGEQGEEFRDADARDVGLDGGLEGTAVVVAGFGFGVEGIEMCRSAPHPDLDDGFRLGLGCGGDQGRGGAAAEEQAEGAVKGMAASDFDHRGSQWR